MPSLETSTRSAAKTQSGKFFTAAWNKTESARRLAALLVFSLAAAAPAWAQSHKLSAADIRKEIQDGGPSTVRRAPDNIRIPDRYIVLFAPSVANPHQEGRNIVQQLGGKLHHTYGHAVQGFAATLSPEAVEQLRHDPRILMIEEDRIVRGTALPLPVSPQAPAPSWALDRLDQRGSQLDNSFAFPASSGAGVHIYMIDSGFLGGIFGLAGAHQEYEGRVGDGADFQDPPLDGGDCAGHGTLTASLAAGTTMGVAKLATLHPVRVLDCNIAGSASGVIAGVNWVTQDHLSHPGQKSVANMSLTVNTVDPAVDQAVQNSINAGIVYTIASGNTGDSETSVVTGIDFGNSCNLSPQRVGGALTVGAMDDITGTDGPDFVPSFSDTGGCVDFYAPGVSISGASRAGTTAYTGPAFDGIAHLGTSYSAPLAAGVAAVFWAAHPNMNASTVASAIVANTTLNALTLQAGRFTDGNLNPNRLLYSDFQTDIQTGVSSNQGAPAVGAQFAYTFQVKNNGPYNSMDAVKFTDDLPIGLGLVNVPPGGVPAVATTRGSCSGGTNISCDLGPLAVGESAVITITVISTTPQAFTNTGTAVLQSGQTDRAPANNTASITLISH
jgi:uncharacterized repeat protein (TIGR01451 family)